VTVCGEAIDGLEVVEKAKALKPDLDLSRKLLPTIGQITEHHEHRGNDPQHHHWHDSREALGQTREGRVTDSTGQSVNPRREALLSPRLGPTGVTT